MSVVADFVARYTSRKFVVAVGAAVALAQQGQYEAAAAVVGAFIFAEAGIDLVAARKSGDDALAVVRRTVEEAAARADEAVDAATDALDRVEQELAEAEQRLADEAP